jgi:hypothetical protein
MKREPFASCGRTANINNFRDWSIRSDKSLY